MADVGRRLLDVGVKTTLANTDKIVVIFNAANTTTAQTALISVTDFFANVIPIAKVANLNIADIRSDPANSTVLTITQGQIFFSNAYIYVAVANNTVKRVAISTF